MTGQQIYNDDGGGLHTFVDEGYSGRGALKEAGYDDLSASSTGRIDITPGQYKAFLKHEKR